MTSSWISIFVVASVSFGMLFIWFGMVRGATSGSPMLKTSLPRVTGPANSLPLGMQLAGEVEFLAARKLHLLLSFEVVEHGLHDVEHLLPIHLALRFMNFQSHEEGRRTCPVRFAMPTDT